MHDHKELFDVLMASYWAVNRSVIGEEQALLYVIIDLHPLLLEN